MLHEFWHSIGGDTARFLPSSSSTLAGPLNHLTAYLLGLSLFFVALIFLCMLVFCIKYRRRTPEQLAHDVRLNTKLEIAWTLIPFALIMIAFFWGARLYLEMDSPPDQALSVYVYGKQWMWKFEHEDGISEINELHIPIGKNVRLTMIAQDVIHSFFVPEFRVKFDLLPGRYTRAWFQANSEGKYHILCSQYCGTDHSRMTGTVFALSSAAFALWKTAMRKAQPAIPATVSRGEQIFHDKSCATCHDGHTDRAPDLHGLFGTSVTFTDGRSQLVNESYLRQSILEPNAEIVAGYSAVMPTYAGQLSEAELSDLVSYIRFLGTRHRRSATND